MRKSVAALVALFLGLTLLGAPALAATGITSRLQLRGHLPELGERPTMRAFQTQAAYDSFRTSLGEANVFPAPSNMFMSFDKDILALYSRGNDTGGRCFRTGPNATLDGDTVTLDLLFESGTCGAPSGAHYPFILVSLSRTAADGSSWVTPARSVCASAPGVSDSRACASLGTSTTSPSPAPTTAASPTPTAAATATAPASASPTGSRTAAPTPTVSATPSATRSAVAAASPSAAASASAQPAAGGSSDFLVTAGLVALGVLIGIVMMAARRPRRSIRRIP
ncbi:MAG TPA: hypothetical protein VGR85_08530 [Candidatus Limnocylindria bacterium]|jgi:hypothetical protein|nr:hypothetical protein [Candidatus Limnocylindria bacterium]